MSASSDMAKLSRPGWIIRSSILAVILSVLPVRARAVDVGYYLLYKQEFYSQTGTGVPSPSASNPFRAGSRISLTAAGSIVSATMGVPPPVGANVSYTFNSGDDAFDIQVQAATQTGLDGTAPAGVYTLTVNTAHDGTKVLKPTFPTLTNYPAGPHINNWSAA